MPKRNWWRPDCPENVSRSSHWSCRVTAIVARCEVSEARKRQTHRGIAGMGGREHRREIRQRGTYVDEEAILAVGTARNGYNIDRQEACQPKYELRESECQRE